MKQPQLERLHKLCRSKGQHVALYADRGRLTYLAIQEGGKRVRSVAMYAPRPLTVEQAAKELLPSWMGD